MTPKYPNIVVELCEHDGNAFMVLTLCYNAMRKAGLSTQEIDVFTQQATASDYDNLLQTALQWFTVE